MAGARASPEERLNCVSQIERTRLQQAEFAAWQTAELATLEPQLAAAQTAQSAVLQRCIEAAARLDYALRETAALVSACEERGLDDTVGGAWAGPSVAVSEEEEEAAALEQDAQMDLVEKRAQVRHHPARRRGRLCAESQRREAAGAGAVWSWRSGCGAAHTWFQLSIGLTLWLICGLYSSLGA